MDSDRVILIVDDDERYASLLTEELRDEGYTTIRAGNGLEAIRILKDVKPDLIILDIMMPVMDGMEAVGSIVHLYGDVPVILHSSYPDFKKDFRGSQAAAYVMKSTDFSKLKSVIKKLLKRLQVRR